MNSSRQTPPRRWYRWWTPCALLLALVLGASHGLCADVAVLMSADVEPYKQALAGCKAVLGHRVVTEYNMQGDVSEGYKALSQLQDNGRPDLIIAVGVLALQSVVDARPDVPVVFAMVLNPLGVLGETRPDITGASMNVPLDTTFEMMKQLGPQVRRVGTLYNPAKTAHLVRLAVAAAHDAGLELVTRQIGSMGEAIAGLELLRQDGIDLLWILPDETSLAPEVIEQMLLVSYANKIPVIGLSRTQAQQGAILSLQFASSEDIGKQAGELANRVLEGRKVAEVPYTTVRQVDVTVNLKAAGKLGFIVPAGIIGMASTLIQ